MKKLALLSVLALASCANGPKVKVEACAFGVCASVDTREMTSDIGEAFASITQAVVPGEAKAPVAVGEKAVETK